MTKLNKLEIVFKNRVKNIHDKWVTWRKSFTAENCAGWNSVEALRKNRGRYYRRGDIYKVRNISGGIAVMRRITSMTEHDFQIIRLVP